MAEKNKIKLADEEQTISPEHEAISPKQIIEEKLYELYEDNNAAWLKEVTEHFSETELTKTFFDNADIFFATLIKITKEKREVDPENLGAFLNTIHEAFFTSSPSIINHLSIGDMLVATAEVNQVEELRGYVGQNMVGEFVYVMSFASEKTANWLIEKIENLPSGTKEGAINQLETCFSNAVGNGEWSESGANRIRNIINHFTRSSSPLTQIVSRVAEARLTEEEENPSIGILTYANNRGAGKLHSRAYTGPIVNIAKDMTLSLDRARMARYAARHEEGRDETKGIDDLNFVSFTNIVQEKELNPYGFINNEDISILTQCLRPEVKNVLESELGISFSDISFRAIMALIRFLAEENDETYNRLCSVLDRFPTEKNRIVETFIGCAKDVSFGKNFLSACEDAHPGELKTFLDTYSGIVLQADKIQELIMLDGRAGELTPELTASYTKLAIKKAEGLLRAWQKELTSAHQKGTEYTPEPEALERFRDAEVQAVVFSSIFEQARKEYGVSAFEIMGGFEIKEATELSETERQEVVDMYRVNYEKTDPELYQALVKIFTERCTKPKVTAYILKDGDKIVSFLTCEPFAESPGYHRARDVESQRKDIYFGSFNTAPNYQDMAIGDSMMKKVLDEYAKEHIIHADCSAVSPIGAKYIEDGFVGITTYSYKNTPSLEIVRDDSRKFDTKGQPAEEFVQEFLTFELSRGTGVCDQGDYLIIKASTQAKINMSYLEEGNILTRYFSQTTNGQKEWYAVFEKKK